MYGDEGDSTIPTQKPRSFANLYVVLLLYTSEFIFQLMMNIYLEEEDDEELQPVTIKKVTIT